MKFRFVLIMIIAFSLTACIGPTSQVPLATTYEYSTQQKMQAAHHWDVLATDVATQIKHEISISSVAGHAFSVANNDNAPFHNAFADMLITQLVNQGLDVRSDPAPSGLQLTFDTQVVKHSDRGYIRKPAGRYTKVAAIGPGVWAAINIITGHRDFGIGAAVIGAGVATDFWSGDITTISNKEVIIHVSLMQDDAYIMRKTGIYYINDPDDKHYIPDYIPPPVTVPVPDDERRIKIIVSGQE